MKSGEKLLQEGIQQILLVSLNYIGNNFLGCSKIIIITY